MFQVRWFVALVLVVITLAGAAIASAADPVTVNLAAQNNSGESGTATLTDLGNGKTQVVINITGAPAGVPQPVHIHKGTCATLDPKPTYPLTNAVDGKSETTVDASLADLQSGGFSINGHKSAQEASVYVFCGSIPAAAAALPTTGADVFSSMTLMAALGLVLLLLGLGARRAAALVR